MAQHFVDWWSKFVLFGSRGCRQFVRRPPKHWIQVTVHCEDSEAWWRKHHDGCFSYYVLVLFVTFQESWISLSTLKYLKRLCCLMPKRKFPWNGCFNKTTTPNTPVSKQHLGSRQTRLTLWSKLVGGHQKCCFWGKTKKCRGIVVPSWARIPFHRCQNPYNTGVKQFSETVAIQLNVSSVIHKKVTSSSMFLFIQWMFDFVKKNADCYFFEQPNIPFSSLSVK